MAGGFIPEEVRIKPQTVENKVIYQRFTEALTEMEDRDVSGSGI
jgi:hypothetical protein